MKKSNSNNHPNSRNEVLEKAVELIRSGISIENNPLIQKYGKAEMPVPIHDLKDRIVSWFVGITVKDRIVSFLQFDENLKFMRYSTFLQKNDSVESCPKAVTWLNPTYVQKLARTKASPDDILFAPFMTYDRNPSRIVWAVRATDSHNHIKTILVCGSFVYLNSLKAVDSPEHV